jgi:hypothetical protein
MLKHKLTPLCIAIGMALAGSASAATVDFSGSNFYMKFLDGNMRKADANKPSIDTASGTDQGQFTELNLVFKATLSSKVEAGGRIQSRSSDAYWSQYGGFGQENGTNMNNQKFMKLRGAYVELSPSYNWLSQVRIGTSDWGMFDPFTVGKVRYIDRDNFNGLYFKGPLAGGNSWELARISLPTYLQLGWGGPGTGGSDATQYNEAIYIAQFKVPVGRAKLTTSYQSFIDHALGSTSNQYSGTNTKVETKNSVFMLRADGSPVDGVDVRGAVYRSSFDIAPGLSPAWGYNSPSGNKNDGALKLDADLNLVDGLALNLQYFNIGAGYHSIGAARRESDVLLTEGTESAWYNWGSGGMWAGGATADYTQSATNVYMTDNDYMDFNESPAQSVLGWKGLTALAKLDVANSPMSLEVTRVGYNSNWQGYPTTGPLAGGQFGYSTYQDRSTNIFAFKLNHLFHVMGGLDANFKLKKVDDRNRANVTVATDDRAVNDTGATASVGNQLSNDLYGTISYGRYLRDINAGANIFNNSKSIYSLKFAYNLPGFETGLLTQWIQGSGNPTETVGAGTKIQQYRLKAYSQVNF